MRRFRAPWVIFWVAFGLRVAVVLLGHTYRIRIRDDHFDFGFEAGRIARSLVEGRGYGNPFNGESGPTAWLSPAYPLLMALVFKLFGVYTQSAALLLLVCNSLFSAAIVPALYEIGARCFDAGGFARRTSGSREPVATWSAWMWAVYPAALQYAVHWVWEMSLSACLFSWTAVLALRLKGVGESGREGGRPSSYGRWLVLGVLWGLLGLSNPALLLCLPLMIGWVLWRPRRGEGLVGFGRDIWGPLLACVVFLAVLAPWAVRNKRVLGAVVLTRSNFGVELYDSTLESNDGLPWGTAMPLWAGDPVFQRYVHEGEVRFARERGEEARRRIRARPGRFLRWTAERVTYFWDGTPHSPEPHPWLEYGRQLSYSFLSVCGLLGLALMLRRRVPGAGLFAILFLAVPLPYYGVTVQPRFRHPLEPLIAVLAVFLFRSAETGRLPSGAGRMADGKGFSAAVGRERR